MAKAAKKTSKPIPKKKVSKYHEKIKIEGTFEDVMKVLSKPIKSTKK
ncbi:hypothetical protein BH10BAC2_BH10BAC2_48940 [soil metagenome]